MHPGCAPSRKRKLGLADTWQSASLTYIHQLENCKLQAFPCFSRKEAQVIKGFLFFA